MSSLFIQVKGRSSKAIWAAGLNNLKWCRLSFSQKAMTVSSGGHPGSRHYADMTAMWRRGEYHPMLWDREQVEAQAKGRMELSPN